MTISKTAAQVITTVSLVGMLGGGCGSIGITRYLAMQPEISGDENFDLAMSGSTAALAFMGGFYVLYCVGAVARERRKEEEEAERSKLEQKVEG